MRLKENEIIKEFTNRQEWFEPLRLIGFELRKDTAFDAVIEFSIRDGSAFKAAAHFLTTSTPKMVSQKAMLLRQYTSELQAQKLVPMIVAPYISKNESERLFAAGVSWIDLSGNMCVQVPPSIYIERTGKPNRYPDTSPIKNIYKGNASVVGRALLVRPEGFSTLNQVVNFIKERNGTITPATVSKVLTSLEENLIIGREKGRIYLKQPARLLDNLAEGYVYYAKQQKNKQYQYDIENLSDVTAILEQSGAVYAYCGFYAASLMGLGVTERITILVRSIQDIQRALKSSANLARPDPEYGQVTFIETDNPAAWFNIQDKPIKNTVDDIELYLELANDIPRGPKIAAQLRTRILEKWNG